MYREKTIDEGILKKKKLAPLFMPRMSHYGSNVVNEVLKRTCNLYIAYS